MGGSPLYNSFGPVFDPPEIPEPALRLVLGFQGGQKPPPKKDPWEGQKRSQIAILVKNPLYCPHPPL